MATARKAPKPWVKGQSGNPKGRPPGRSPITRMRESLTADIPEILAALVIQAKAGDPQAARLILERVLPTVKATEQPTAIQIPAGGTLTAQGRAVLAAVSSGALAPGQGSQLIAAIGTLARVAEIDELETRIAALESKK